MQYLTGTQYRACTLVVTIKAAITCVAYLQVRDSKLPNTYLSKRFYQFAPGEQKELHVQMPITGKAVIAAIFENESDIDAVPVNFKIVSVEKKSLPAQMDVVNMVDPVIRHFVRFAQRFCFNAGVLPTYSDRFYKSDSGGYLIRYVPTISDVGSGEQLTPARINKFTKEIEVSKSKFLPMTVPMRFCILCHEFSHLYLNEDMYDELEADLNGLVIYLGLGYPRIEAHETFLSTFYHAPSDENMARYDHIKNFIEKFDELNFTHL
jgi:hypothetical protein